jgi:glycosyltransferase involved in cell wall biosynthesis
MLERDAPLVSFVVPCYNYGRYLPDCLNSIFRQEGDYPFEIIAIDDASSDNTPEVLAQFQDPRMRVLRHEKNEGHVKAISQGLRESRGRYVARIDPDDRYRTCFLSEAIPRFEQYSEVGFVYGDAALINSEGCVDHQRSDRVHGGKDFKGNEFIPLLVENFVCAPTVIARREAWLDTLPIPPDLAFSDWYFNLMIARRHEFYYVSRVLADYRVHGANHHSKVIINKTEEPSIRFLLDKLYAEPECNIELQQAKERARGRVYSSQYLTMANKYFGAGYTSDARRCYFQAIRNFPNHLLSFTILRRLGATFLDANRYNGLKKLLRRSPAGL